MHVRVLNRIGRAGALVKIEVLFPWNLQLDITLTKSTMLFYIQLSGSLTIMLTLKVFK